MSVVKSYTAAGPSVRHRDKVLLHNGYDTKGCFFLIYLNLMVNSTTTHFMFKPTF